MTGKVWLVGAGPGDVGLFTLKGRQVLENAQVVVYDSLVGDGVLALVPPEAKRIFVGKRSGNHTVHQWRINEILLEQAQQGLRVVRLKGGDPFLFGRGGEELELLEENGIPFEVVPGVTSCIAVPAYNGIPVTHRDFCSSLHVITGHKRAGETYNIDFEALVRTKGTLVFLMGITALPDICAGLMAAGMAADMPAAVLQQGTTARQKRVVATVGTLQQEVERQGIETPAIIVVGKVCTVADRFSWYEHLPLFGCKVLLTRPRALQSAMAEKLRTAGAEVLELPTIEIRGRKTNAVAACIRALDQYDVLAFTSPSAFSVFWQAMQDNGRDVRALAKLRIAALGTGTARALKEKGIIPDWIPQTGNGGALGRLLVEVCPENARILLPRAAEGSPELMQVLAERADLVCRDEPFYDTICQAEPVMDVAGLIEKGRIDCAVFTSASTVRGLVNTLPGTSFAGLKAVCIGEQTRMEAEKAGMPTIVSEKTTMDSLVEAVIALHRRKD